MKGWIPFTEREVSTGENSFLKVATLGLGALAGGTLLNNIDASANTVEQNTTAHEKNVSTKTTLNTDTFEIGQVSNTATNENSTSESVSESESISESVSESESTSESVSESESTSESVSESESTSESVSESESTSESVSESDSMNQSMTDSLTASENLANNESNEQRNSSDDGYTDHKKPDEYNPGGWFGWGANNGFDGAPAASANVVRPDGSVDIHAPWKRGDNNDERDPLDFRFYVAIHGESTFRFVGESRWGDITLNVKDMKLTDGLYDFQVRAHGKKGLLGIGDWYSYSAIITIQVSSSIANAQSISISGADVMLYNTNTNMSYLTDPVDAYGTVLWSVDDKNLAEINQYGVLTSKGVTGTVTVTVVFVNGDGSQVTASKEVRIADEVDDQTVAVGDQATFSITPGLISDDEADVTYKWYSVNDRSKVLSNDSTLTVTGSVTQNSKATDLTGVDGSQYYVVTEVNGQSHTSNIATLHVTNDASTSESTSQSQSESQVESTSESWIIGTITD
ncbi:hypothetical protein [Weissella diestrammenae]|nr:hypothetical protein [Weissella diestrammenae]